jgi:putative ABC transport system permease protein
MNLAIHDIRHNAGRFTLTAAGIGLLLMTVLGMSGIYRGMIADALVIVDHIGADLWVVQRDTRGPFAEVSRVPSNLEERLRAVPGVASARNFVSHTIQRERRCASPCRAWRGPTIAGRGCRWSPAGRSRRRISNSSRTDRSASPSARFSRWGTTATPWWA